MRLVKYWLVGFVLILVTACGGLKKSSNSSNNKTVKKTLTEQQKMDFNYAFIDGNKQMMLGNYEMAKKIFEQCIKLNPYDDASYYKLASIALYENNIDEAEIFAETAYNYDKSNIWYAVLIAKIYEQKGKIEKAINVYKEIIEINGDEPEFLVELSILYQKEKNYSEAIKIYDKIEKKFGFSEMITLDKEKLYVLNNQKDLAKKEIEKLIEYFPDNTQYTGILADYYMDSKEYEKAKELYDEIIKKDKNNGIVYISLANYFQFKGKYNKVFESLKIAMKSDNVDPMIKNNVIVNIIDNKSSIKLKKEEIKDLVEILIDSNTDNYTARLIYYDILVKEKKYQEAQNQLTYVVEEIKDRYVIWEQLLYVQNLQSDYESMYYTSKEAKELFPNKSLFHFFHGLSAMQIDSISEAIETFNFGQKLVTKNDPEKLQFYTYLAECYYKQKNYEEAFLYYDKILEVEPENYLVLNNYSYYLSLLDKDLDKAKKMSKKTIDKEPNNDTYLDTYAWILFQLKETKEALKYIKKAYDNGGNASSVINDHYGDILLKNNLKKEAIKMWENALTLDKNNSIIQNKINKYKNEL